MTNETAKQSNRCNLREIPDTVVKLKYYTMYDDKMYQKWHTWLCVSIKWGKNNTTEPSVPFLIHNEKCIAFIVNNINIII